MKKIVIIAGVALALSLPAATAMAATPKPHITKPGANSAAKKGTAAHEGGESGATQTGEGKSAKKVAASMSAAKTKKVKTKKVKKVVKKK